MLLLVCVACVVTSVWRVLLLVCVACVVTSVCGSTTINKPVNFPNTRIDQLEMLIGNLLKKIPWERYTGMESTPFSPVHCPHGQRN